MSAFMRKRAPLSYSHKGTIWAISAQVVEIHFSHPGNIESKIIPTEIQAVVLIITFSRRCLLKSSDTLVQSSLIGTFFGNWSRHWRHKAPKEFEQRNSKENSKKKRCEELAYLLLWGHLSIQSIWIMASSSLNTQFVFNTCSVKGQHLRNSTVIKTFIKSSQFRYDIGTRLRSGAHMTTDNFTCLCQEKFHTYAFANMKSVSLPPCEVP